MNRFFILLTSAAGLLLGSCSQPAPPPEKTQTPIYVGKVERVYPTHNYALLYVQGRPLQAGTVLISQSDGTDGEVRVANLVVSDERLGRRRLPADIRSGAVRPGDRVFLYRNLASPDNKAETTSPEEGDTPSQTTDVTPTENDSPADLPSLSDRPEEQPTNAAQKRAEDEQRALEEQERILKQLEGIPDRIE